MRRKIFVTQNIAESMWVKLLEKVKSCNIRSTLLESLEELETEAKAEDTEIVNIIDNKALLNEINKRAALNLVLNSGGLRAEIKDKEDEQYAIYCISTSNLSDLYKYAKEEELPSGVNLQVIKYEF